jgi:hypothetical protein
MIMNIVAAWILCPENTTASDIKIASGQVNLAVSGAFS